METFVRKINVPGYSLRITEYLSEGSAKSVKVVINIRKLQIVRLVFISSIFSCLAFLLRIHEYSPEILLVVVLAQMIVLFYRIRHKVVTETLMLVGGLGAQSTLTYYTGKCQTKFIPWTSLLDVIIAEAITMHQILYYMGCLIQYENREKNEEEIIPLFMHVWPKLDSLQQIYRSCQKVLISKQNGRKHKRS